MQGRTKSGQLVTVTPVSSLPNVGDADLCKVEGCYWLHLVTAVSTTVRY
jgi:hypothetical protein